MKPGVVTTARRSATLLGVVLGALVASGCRGSDEASEPPFSRLDALAVKLEGGVMRAEAECAALAAEIRGIYGNLDELAARADPSAYVLEENGTLHRPTAVANRDSAVFVSGVVPVNEEILRVVHATEAADPALKRAVEENEQVVQAYYNDRHSFNRIYPPFDVVMQYPPGMKMEDYNFYYLADQAHNPARVPVWVKQPYVDPAGRGWMVSCVAPVYTGNDLQGVAGLDITIETLVRGLDFEGDNRFCLLLTDDGTVVATGAALVQVLRLPPLKSHRYVDTVRSDTFRSDQYNLCKSSSLPIRRLAAEVLVDGGSARSEALLRLDDREWKVRVRRIRNLNWRLLAFSLNR